MNVISVSKPVYSSADNSSIDCLVQFDVFPNPLPFNASPKDTTDYGKQIYADCVAGKYGPIGAYVPTVIVRPTGAGDTTGATGPTII
jgi:hypothetical protein